MSLLLGAYRNSRLTDCEPEERCIFVQDNDVLARQVYSLLHELHSGVPRSDQNGQNASILYSRLGGATDQIQEFYVRLREFGFLLKETGYH